SNMIKEVAKSLKEECNTLLKKSKEEYDEEINANTINLKKSYYLDCLNTIEENYKYAYDDLISGVELREMLGQEYSQWDKTLNEIWSVLKEQLPNEEIKGLTQNQKTWIKTKKADADFAQEEGGTGTLGLEMRADSLL
ncbi:DUF1311 domain-containing protein, partial [Clostridium perfringens]